MHVLSHQAWMPTCRWETIERTDGSAYVRGYMDPDVPDAIGRPRLDALTHYLGGQVHHANAGHPAAWHGTYGRVRVCVSMPERPRDTAAAVPREHRPQPSVPAAGPCPVVDRVRSWAGRAELRPADAAALAAILADEERARG